jgi:hypothetical protein
VLRRLIVALFLLPVVFAARAHAQTFTSSNLPIVVIDTRGASIVNEPKVGAHMGIVDNGPGARNRVAGPFNAYDGFIGIELRGDSTQNFDKKSFGIETRTESGEERGVRLLGLPRESDWVLSAAFIDKTFLRDPLAFEVSRRMGRWASHAIHCELVLNGEYHGLYILEERIKRDRGRVDIDRLEPEDDTAPAITGGYIFELGQRGPGFDKRRRFVYPRADDITPAQVDYLRSYDDEFRRVMESASYADPETGYAAWIDVDSFVDELIVQELSKNTDGFGWSTYFHKPRNGKLRAGPVWDFDQAFSNSTHSDGPNHAEWMVERPAHDALLAERHPPFWRKLFDEAAFRARVVNRWRSLRTDALRTDRLMAFIDALALRLDEAQSRNFQRWPILGVAVWRSTPGAEQRTTYQSEVEYLKAFLASRLAWMDAALADGS